MKKKKILFISHDASLSGAPVLLLNLLRLLQEDKNIRLRIILKRGGVLVNEFKKIADTVEIKPAGYLQKKTMPAKLIDFALSRVALLKCCYWNAQTDFIFNNTITNGRLLRQINWQNKPVVSYIHELYHVAKLFDRTGDSIATIEKSRLLLCPSNEVAGFLQHQYKVPNKKLVIFPYYFPFEENIFSDLVKNKSALREIFAKDHSIDPGSIWIVAMGTICSRKGYDLFLEVAEACYNKDAQKFSFIWIGEAENSDIAADVKNRLAGMEADVHFCGALKHSYANLLPFDIFFSASREDPYPLVVLEAAIQQLPAICFADSGGIKEFIENDAGWIVARLSVADAAAMLNNILPEEIAKKGRAAKNKVLERHGNKECIKNLFDSLITIH